MASDRATPFGGAGGGGGGGESAEKSGALTGVAVCRDYRIDKEV
eukprot:CAMPEP_0113316128 /NCGR_PEP_ID=MMETSP0010_2-20120614/11516_1 /TAXON_ID=216773 ORGANISM="Corethron hystrix, Strain 308" /NCGR_SAMPLE_ID=MMETSP0010_2 /ASSEMBLY_ACC=CAM_ASM_000155 /LENGTH=43 /DNA_ID=CAMNT_0000172759 /DNA_START=287 /DNA_END=418 /DNA_ORIENTATION=- /assembly_acc=CAM_ASM_000155